MSGRKYSTFQLQRQMEERLRMLRQIADMESEVEGLRERTRTLLDEMPAGLRATFGEEVRQAENWLQAEAVDLRGLHMQSESMSLRHVRNQLSDTSERGRKIQQQLYIAVTHKADQMGQKLGRSLAELETGLAGRLKLLQLWFSPEQLRPLEQKLTEARKLLQEQQYSTLGRLLREAGQELGNLARQADAQESKHQRRLYLLKALRQVCAEMGFQEVAAPRYEQEGNRGSRILMTVDTVDRGRIEFILALDGISTWSEISDQHCFEEFGQLSRYLEESFGVQTHFQRADGEPAPRLIEKEEAELPGEAGREMEK